MFKISTVAFQARDALRSSGVNIPHSNALELVAASIGYGTYAALKLNPSLDGDDLFPVAEHVVLQADALEQRLQDLGLEKQLTQAVSMAIRDAFTREVHDHDRSCQFHTSMSDFQDFIFQDVQEQAYEDNNVSDAYAETNAYMDEFYANGYEFNTLAKSDEEWTLVATGTHTGEVDEDRVYYGHAGNFTATYTFKKDGRSGLVLQDLEFGLDFERSYDRDDEK
ncbi:MAG: hypothetical protein M3Q42_01325 [Pseudomonadota bacterium]|nr:hypothetical protein [Pseudomonadota bacterium]